MYLRAQLTLLSLLIMSVVCSQNVRISYTFETPVFIDRHDGYVEPVMEKCLNLADEGQPLLPAFSAQILLPQGKEIADVKVVSIGYAEPILHVNIVPAARQFPFSEPAPADYKPVPDQAIYQSSKNYPSELITDVSTQFLAGHSIAVFTIRPLTFNPNEKTAQYVRSIELEIETRNISRKIVQPAFQSDRTKKRLSGIVANPDMIASYHFNPERDADPVDMLIITKSSFVNAFSAYAEYKTGRGFIVEIVTTEHIYAAYSGSDNQEKIRNCIIDYYENHGIGYVILGGDSDTQNSSHRIAPHRGFFVDTGFGYEDSDIPSDMYYACLDGTWDNNNNGLFGEPGEEDLFAEVLIGRMCIDSNTEVENMIHKLIMYQDNPVIADIEKALMIGESLDASTWGGTYKDEVAHGSSNNGYTTVGVSDNFNINKLYEMTGNWNKNHVFNQFNVAGINLLNHLGHSSVNYNMKMYTNDLTVTNFQNNGITRGYVIGYSQGCYNGSFDNRGSSGNYSTNDCFAERITTMETAMVASISNSRYGWYSQNSTNGASQYFDRKFFNAIFGKGIDEIGGANGDSKEDNISFIMNNQVIRWCAYELNLFGDPSMSIWTQQPTDINANYPDALPIGIGSVVIETDAPGARIGLTQDGELIGRAIADDYGNVNLNFFEIVSSNTPINISITAHNRNLHTGIIPVIADQPYVIVESFVINDESGNNNGIPEYGEHLLIGLTMKNLGNVDAENVLVTLSSNDNFVTLSYLVVDFGDIPAGESVFIADAFPAIIADNIPDQHQITIQVQASGIDTWNSTFSFTVGAPSLLVTSLLIDDTEGGNGNGRLDPGEEVVIIINLHNLGSAESPEMIMQLTSANSNLTVLNGEDSHDGLMPGEECVFTFTALVDDETTMGDLAELQTTLAAGAYELVNNFLLEIGMIIEDFSSGDFAYLNWEFDGDQPWTICEVDPFDGLYCARSGSINHNQATELKVSVFVAQPDTISFYRKVSSEAGYDYLKFYDGPMLRGQWAGIEAWEKVSFPVYAGYHTFRWVYEKDQNTVQGEDCAWIDYIRFPRLLISHLEAGADDMVCEGNNYQTKSSGVYLINILWNTSGTGTFNNANILQPVYTPSAEDIANGSVILTVSATGAGNNTLSDSMTLSIVNEPATPEMPSGETEVCTNYGISYDYVIPEVPHTLNYTWELSPQEAGTLDIKNNAVDITWTPDYTGNVLLHVKASNDCGESEFSEALEITANICTGIDEVKKSGVTVYPNPTDGLLTIKLPKVKDAAHLYLYNALGRQMLSKILQPTGETIELDLRDYPSGIYYLKIESFEIDFYEKVILK